MDLICNIILNKKNNYFNIIKIPFCHWKTQDNLLKCFNDKLEMIACFNYNEIIGFYITEG